MMCVGQNVYFFYLCAAPLYSDMDHLRAAMPNRRPAGHWRPLRSYLAARDHIPDTTL